MLELEQIKNTEQEIEKKRLYSFDIFDTLITRTVAEPTGIFSIIEYRLQTEQKYNSIPQILRQNFYEIRINAEGYARAHKRYLDNTFQDLRFSEIYDYIKSNYNLTDEQSKTLMDLEIQTEIDNIVPIDKNIEILKTLLQEGNRVICISDMYHSEYIIRKILSNIDKVFNDIAIYVSSEYDKMKTTGDLYKYVQEVENIDINNWTHYGDNINSDINKAKELKINAIHIPQGPLMPYEKYLLKEGICSGNDAFNQMVVGCSKYTRTISEDKSNAYQFGCSFAAPILYQYVNWVIEQAVERNIKTLHFLARDGYILKLIAEEIVKQKGLNIKLNYLYGSRKAWRLPTEETYEDFINYMTSEYLSILTPKFLAERLNIEVSDIEKYYGKKLPDRVINKQELNDLKTFFFSNIEFKKEIIYVHSTKVELVKEYFKQEFGDADSIYIVDLYGTGRTQDLLSKLLYGSNNNKTIFSFYFTMGYDRPENPKCRKISYFSTKNYQHWWVELFCRTTHGQTLVYKREENKIIPVLDEIRVQNIIDWGYEAYKKALLDYTKNIINIEKKNRINISSIKTYIKYHNFFFKRLDKKTAEIIGDIPFTLEGSEFNVTACAPEFTEEDYKKLLHEGNKDFSKPLSFISFRRSDPKFAKLYERNKRYGNLKGYIKKKYIYKIFSTVNSDDKKHKIVTILGIKLKFKRRRNA